MAFRDDREALRARAEMLEGDLEHTSEELRRTQDALRAQEEKDERDEDELARLRKRLAKLEKREIRKRAGREKSSTWYTPAGKSAKRGALAGILVLLIPMAVGIGIFVALGDDSPPLVPTNATAPTVVAETPESPPPTATARFGALVVSDTGFGVPVGSGCVIEARLAGGPTVSVVLVTCGAVVYDSATDDAADKSVFSSQVSESLRNGARVYSMRFSDQARREGERPFFHLDTTAGSAEIRRADGAALVLAIDDWSVGRHGIALSNGAHVQTAGSDLRLHAVVTESSGPAPELPAEGCDVFAHASPRSGRNNCRIRVRCGDDLLYGDRNSGFNECAIENGAIVAANDEGTSRDDGDPILLLRRDEGRLLLEDSNPRGHWRIDFRLEADARCNLDGEWTGQLVASAPGDTTTPLRMNRSVGLEYEPPVDGFGQGVVPLARPTVHAVLADDLARNVDCDNGSFELIGEDGLRFSGHFGPDFASLIGSVNTGASALATGKASEEHGMHFWLRRSGDDAEP